MSVTETINYVKEKKKINLNKREILITFFNFILGLVFSFSGFSTTFSPFGVAFASSGGKRYMTISALGASLGYILSGDSISSLRYIASILALIVIFGALKPFKELRESIATPVISTFICLFVTGLAVVLAEKFSFLSFLICFSESLFGACATFLFTESRTVLTLKGSIFSLTSKEAISLVICFSLMLLSLRNISVFNVYPAHIIATVIILICGKYSKEAGGTIVGVCTGITMSLRTGNIFLLAFYSLGGLIAGVVSTFGKIASFIAFSLSGVLVSIIAYEKFDDYGIIIETIIAGLIFIFLPRRINNRLEEILSPRVNSPIIDNVKSDIMRKLKNASEISNEICDSLNVVSDALYKSEKADMKKIYKKTKESICGSCGLYDACWNESFNDTQDCFNTLITLKKDGVYLENKTIPQQFASKCIRSEMVSSSFNKLFSEYIIKERLESRINEIQTLASEQFINVASLLDSLCDSLTEEVRFDMDLAAKARAAASSLGFEPIDSCCVINSLEKITIELKLKRIKENENLKPLLRQLEIISNKKLEYPEIMKCSGFITLLFKEKADFKVVSAGVQYCSTGQKYSGDTYSTFTDDNGIFYSVICDGMGTGTKAAIGSNLAVSLLEKLIKAGFGIEAAINTVNTSLISKSGDECSVTLDLVMIDLFTGHIEFFKCGAQDTVVRKNKRIHFINSPSLPLGIIKDAETSNGNGTLSEGDVIIMSTDGVREEDFCIIEREVKYFNNENVRNFTEKLGEKIRELQPTKNDDLTIVTLLLLKND
ncbi:MAG: hypothetical protein E7557_00610 [Ruminococcaceae bacterium]|nr:hypothetical protein [Oscillospiraceae bacterium]